MRHIKTIRQLFNIKQKDLADKSGICVREIARIESGEVYPIENTAIAINTAIDKLIENRLIKSKLTDTAEYEIVKTTTEEVLNNDR